LSASPVAITVIIPVLNEGKRIEGTLRSILALGPDEVIVADGGSSDDTQEIACRYARLVVTKPGRGVQLNAGAAEARGEILLFLHADARLGPDALDLIRKAVWEPGVRGGCLSIAYEGDDWTARAFTAFARLRRRVGVIYGDSGIFCQRHVFEELGGYQPWPILEDYEFYRRLRRRGQLALLDETIEVSDRRWRKAGLVGALWNWFWIQGLYWLGVSPHRLARMYKDIR